MGHGKSALALVLCLAAARALVAAEVVSCPVLVIGGSASGVAAAHAAYQLFKEWQVTDQRVCLVEETGWLGGQFLTVGELDEPPNVGGWPVRGPYSRSYRELRKGVQDAALMKYGPYACSSPPFGYDTFDPGRNTANLLAYEPSLIVPLIQAKLAPASPPPPGPPLPIRVFLHTRVTAKRLSSDGATVLGVDAHDDEHGVDLQLNATYTIDATEFGDLLGPAWGPATPNRVGVDAFSVASEPSAPATADPYCTQPVTVPIYLKWTTPAFVPQPSNWSALQGFYYKRPELCAYDPAEPGCGVPPLCTPPGFTTARESYWSWRRIHSRTQFANGGVDSTNIIVHGLRIPVAGNPDPQAPTVGGNDFNRNCDTGPGGCELVADLAARPAKLARALDLSRGFAYFMQTTMAPGSPSTVTPWQLATEVTDDAFGAGDGFAPVPYVRESRRLKAVKTVREQDISRDILQQTYGPGRTRGEMFTDTVGIGHYAIDIHDCAAGDPWHDTPTNPNPPLDRAAVLPFQVPLGAMVPAAARFADGRVPTEGLLATGKNMGLTHITNGAYRLQPIEWHSGLAAGAAAAVAIQSGSSPRFMPPRWSPSSAPARARTCGRSAVSSRRWCARCAARSTGGPTSSTPSPARPTPRDKPSSRPRRWWPPTGSWWTCPATACGSSPTPPSPARTARSS